MAIFSFVCFLNFTAAAAQEGCVVPTIPGEVTYPPGWNCECDGGEPDAYTLSDTATRGTYTTVWVDSKVERIKP